MSPASDNTNSKEAPITAEQRGFMLRAIQLAVENARSASGGPFGAVVVKDGRIIAEGSNRVTATHDPTAHAEIVAVRQACKVLGTFQLEGCEIYASCEPCPMCLGAIYWARPAHVYFAGLGADAAAAGFDDAFILDQLRVPVDARSLPMTQFMREEALEAFRQWRANPAGTGY